MSEAQLYCTVAEVLADLRLAGDDNGQVYRYISSASRFLRQRLGNFIPITDTRYYGVEDSRDLQVDPLLAVTTITNNGVTLSDYLLYPLGRYWANGPYTRIVQDGVWAKENDVVIAGRWGMYEQSVALGINGTQAASSTATLTVTNGALLSPGMVLLLESEQELVTGYGARSDSTGTLAGSVDEDDEHIASSNGALFSVGEIIQVDFEQMKILDIATNILYVTRGWNSTSRTIHANAVAIYAYRTFNTTRGVNGTTAAAHNNVALSRYVVPDDLNYLAREMAVLAREKALSKFAGRIGNVETGESFYYNEFPQSQIEAVARNYRIVRL